MEIQTSTGQKAYRAECHGVFENGSACMAAAKNLCGSRNVHVLQTLEGTNTSGDAREVIFDCVQPAPVAATPPPVPVPASVPAPAPAPTPAPRKIVLDGKTNFDFDSAALTLNAKALLERLVAESQGAKFAAVTVEGFTDSSGSDAYNLALSERRAQAVLDYLRDRGLSADRFLAKGYGRANPVASNATASGRAENRRVEVTLVP
ncbi:OmpA family protein [Caballeronia hypogeia]|nr:OmpA family protein [Caballeronia hypogeia]